MADKPILDKVLAIFGKILESEKIGADSSMENLPEWDSLKHLQIVAAVEETFNIQIPFEDVIRMNSIKNIVDVVEKRQKHE